jgi:REP element-mobilizing transposase RayT
MPRVARIVFPSMPYHIISRRNNQEKVFQQEEDFEKYLDKDQYDLRLYH